MSAARPKIADYPFTTLIPNLGVVQAGEVRFTIADVPGLIEGASEGKGLGHHFLRHVERCAALVHVLDCGTLESDRDPLSDLAIIEAELEKYAVDMSYSGSDGEVVPLNHRPRLVALNKVDLPDGKDMAEFVRPELESSAATRSSKSRRRATKASASSASPWPKSSRPPATPSPRPRRRYTPPCCAPAPSTRPASRSAARKRTSSRSSASWATSPCAGSSRPTSPTRKPIGYLADRLAKLGVENELFKQGAKPGDMVVIGEDDGVVFDWEPTMMAGAELLASPRGTDVRFADIGDRPTRGQKRDEQQERRDAKAAARAELEAERKAGIWTESVSGRRARQPLKESGLGEADDE